MIDDLPPLATTRDDCIALEGGQIELQATSSVPIGLTARWSSSIQVPTDALPGSSLRVGDHDVPAAVLRTVEVDPAASANRELALHFALRSDAGVEVGILGGDIVVRRAGWLARALLAGRVLARLKRG